MIEGLPLKQCEIIERAAGHVKPAERESFRKFVADVLRKPQPCSNTDIRHACAALLFEFSRRA